MYIIVKFLRERFFEYSRKLFQVDMLLFARHLLIYKYDIYLSIYIYIYITSGNSNENCKNSVKNNNKYIHVEKYKVLFTINV